MKKAEILFCVVAVMVLVMAAAVFGVNSYTTQEDTDKPVSQQSNQDTTESLQKSKSSTSVSVTENEPGAELEIGHVYTVSRKINQPVEAFGTDSGFAELNEVQEHLYDIAEDYDAVEYDWLQEQVDNERYLAKQQRDN